MTASDQEAAHLEYEQLREEVDRLRRLLRQYGWHEDDCPVVAAGDAWCSCGWAAVQDELDERARNDRRS